MSTVAGGDAFGPYGAVLRHGVVWPERVRWAARQGAAPSTGADVDVLLARWGAEVDPRGGGLLARRWEAAGLTEETARVVVGGREPVDPPAPDWWQWFRLVVDARADGASEAQSDGSWLDALTAVLPPGADDRVPFAHLLWPACVAAWDRLASTAGALLDDVMPTAGQDLRNALLLRLSEVAAPALAEVMWADVPYGQRLLARIGADRTVPSRSRYAAFCRTTSASGWTEVMTRYPVLGSLLGTVVRQWAESTEELLRRVQGDRDDLEAEFGISAGSGLDRVRTAAGDTHNDGRSVSILEFGGSRVVYKPRDVRLESFLEQVAASLRVVAPEAAVTVPHVLPRQDPRQYGYASFIAHRPCRDEASLRGFYRDAGRVLALVELLGGTDCHHENLIADGEHLVLVDAETLLDAAPPEDERLTPHGVVRTGLLPSWLWLPGPGRAMDVSALGAGVAQSVRGAHGWRSVNSDGMTRGEVTDVPVSHPTSLPTPPGTAPDLTRYVDDLVDGYRVASDVLALVAPQVLPALLHEVWGVGRRVVARPTYVYALLLQASLQPAALESRTARGLVLERMARAFLVDEPAQPWELLRAEQEAIARLDVPYFESPLCGGATRWLGGRIDGWPPADGVAALLARLREGRVARPGGAALVRATVAASVFRMAPGPSGTPPTPHDTPPEARPRAAAWLTALLATSEAQEGAWVVPTLLPDGRHVVLQPIGLGLYDGRMGLAVALFECARGFDDADLRESLTRTADAVLAPVLDLLEGPPGRLRRGAAVLGPGMVGVGGLLRGVDHLQRRGHLDAARAQRARDALLAAMQPSDLREDSALDRLLGTAGLVSPLLGQLARTGGPDVDALVRAAADLLVRRQGPDTGAWTTIEARAPLTGLAHGASGIALALAEAAAALGDESYLDAALRGLAYERRVFVPSAGNWPDFRADAPDGTFMLGWCAGAPGIALTRLRLLQVLPRHDEAGRWEEELRVAADTTAAAGLLGRDHLCCGAAGHVALLRTVAAWTGEPRYASAANGIATAVLDRARRRLPVTVLGGGPDSLLEPGLMTGIAGAALGIVSPDSTDWVTALLL